jgi:hypothetical protein
MMIIAIEMIFAPLALFLLYPRRIFEYFNIPFKNAVSTIPTDIIYIAIFAVFIIVWILNLTPAVRYKAIIEKES